MPVTSSGLVVPVIGDDPADLMGLPTSIPLLDPVVHAPAGNSSNSVQLSSAVDCTANTTTTILSQTITTTRDQWVILAAKTRFWNQSGGAGGFAGTRIEIDGTPDPMLTSAQVEFAANGNIGEIVQSIIPASSVFLTAGTHTIILKGDRDSTASTIRAMASGGQLNSRNYFPTTLTIIV